MLAKGKNQLKLNESEIVKKSKIMKTSQLRIGSCFVQRLRERKLTPCVLSDYSGLWNGP